uniref:hypothetical protein n=1 Tax=uncultured Deefgea sp. TaxID=1304914 RepID=UPI002596740E
VICGAILRAGGKNPSDLKIGAVDSAETCAHEVNATEPFKRNQSQWGLHHARSERLLMNV